MCLSFEAHAVSIPCYPAQTHAQVMPRDFGAIFHRDILVLVMEPDDLKKVEAREGATVM